MLHTENCAWLVDIFSQHLNLPNRNELWQGAILHDIGKLNVKEDVLHKPVRLTDEEYEHIKKHPVNGFVNFDKLVLKDETVRSGILNEELVINMIKLHHERFDGTGYPYGLKGEEIPVESRIMLIVDVFEALSSVRSYKKPFDLDTIKSIMIKKDKNWFDPYLLNEFFKMKFIEDYMKITHGD